MMQRLPVIFHVGSRALATTVLCASAWSCSSAESTTPVGNSSNSGDVEQHESQGGAGANEQAAASFSNAMCPIYTDEEVDPSIFVMYQGARVGLCCKECKREWEDLTDAEKQNFVHGAQSEGDEVAVAVDDAGS
jgi:hypothetical protein